MVEEITSGTSALQGESKTPGNLLYEKRYGYKKRPLLFKFYTADGEIIPNNIWEKYRFATERVPGRPVEEERLISLVKRSKQENWILCPECKAISAGPHKMTFHDNDMYWTCGSCGCTFPQSDFHHQDARPERQDTRIVRTRILRAAHGISVVTMRIGAGFSSNTASVYPFKVVEKTVFNLENGQVYSLAPIVNGSLKKFKYGENRYPVIPMTKSVLRSSAVTPETLYAATAYGEVCDPDIRNAFTDAIADWYGDPREDWSGLSMREILRTILYKTKNIPVMPDIFGGKKQNTITDVERAFAARAAAIRTTVSSRDPAGAMKFLCHSVGKNTTRAVKKMLAEKPSRKIALDFLARTCGFRNKDLISTAMADADLITVFAMQYRFAAKIAPGVPFQNYGPGGPAEHTREEPVFRAALKDSFSESQRLAFLQKLWAADFQNAPSPFEREIALGDIFRCVENISTKNAPLLREIFGSAVKALTEANAKRSGVSCWLQLFEKELNDLSRSLMTEAEMATVIPLLEKEDPLDEKVKTVTFRRARVGRDLFVLGNRLHNCVTGYLNSAQRHICVIVGMYGEDGEPVGCIEVRQGEIRQALTYCNQPLTGVYKEAFDAWVKHHEPNRFYYEQPQQQTLPQQAPWAQPGYAPQPYVLQNPPGYYPPQYIAPPAGAFAVQQDDNELPF